MSASPLQDRFSKTDRVMVETYMLSRAGQVPEAVGRLLAAYDAAQRDLEHAYAYYCETNHGGPGGV